MATKRDLDLNLEAWSTGSSPPSEAEMSAMQRSFTLALVESVSGSTLTAAGLAFAAARLV